MKRVGIITITNSGMNFGNRLQNYALQEKIKEYDSLPETVYSHNVFLNSVFFSNIRRLLKKCLKKDKRRKAFMEFDNKYIEKSKINRYGSLNTESVNKRYDIFIAGSDQIWNPNFNFNSEFEFLEFASKEKRYSYAASVGVGKLSDECIKKYTELLSKMQGISVREEAAYELIKTFINKEINVHIDPTLLYDAKMYSKLEKKPQEFTSEKYILIYFLGKKPKEYIEFVEEVSRYTGYKVIELSETKNSDYYGIGPQHFLYLINNASYKKKFTICQRRDSDIPMNSRIESLLNKFKIHKRLLGELSIQDSINQEVDYEYVSQILKDERIKSDNYFKSFL